MITHDEVRKTLNKTELGESPTRLIERKLLIHDYINQQEQLAKDVARYFNLFSIKNITTIYVSNW